jgi:hypothetical protein
MAELEARHWIDAPSNAPGASGAPTLASPAAGGVPDCGAVAAAVLWWIHEDDYLGRLAIRGDKLRFWVPTG